MEQSISIFWAVILAGVVLLAALVGCLMGAWLCHQARAGRSPVPGLDPKPEEPKPRRPAPPVSA